MKRRLWIGTTSLCAVALAAGCFWASKPRIGHASRAEIDAVLDPMLKIQDPLDPAGEARYGRLTELAAQFKVLDKPDALGSETKPFDPAVRRQVAMEAAPLLEKVQEILNEGSPRSPQNAATFGEMSFPGASQAKSVAKVGAIALADAVDRHDKAAAGRYGKLLLSYSHALLFSGGDLIHGLVWTAVDGVAMKAVYNAEMKSAFKPKERAEILAMIPEESGPSTLFAGFARREFRSNTIPLLLDPEKYLRTSKGQNDIPGSFDPVETARLASRIYVAGIEDLARPFGTQTNLADRIGEEACKGVPEFQAIDSHSFSGWWQRIRLNLGDNTIGRQLFGSAGPFSVLPEAMARFQTNHNLVRAVFLLRSGKAAPIKDLFDGKLLRSDPKRRIVWSVGSDQKDDGGDIGTPPTMRAPDFGYEY